MAFLCLVAAFLANGIANVLLKVGADRGLLLEWSLGPGKLLAHHSFLIGGILLFVLNVGFYVIALRAFPLSVAYPVMVGMSFLIANGAALFFLHEAVKWQHFLGYALILAGVTLVVGAAR